MSLIQLETIKCGCCGTEIMELVLTSSNQLESGDLDFRPGEMLRSTMDVWIMECGKCGFVSYDLSVGKEEYLKYISSDEYKNLEGVELCNPLAIRFYKNALLNLRQKNIIGAYDAFLYAAWSLDDVRDIEGASICRSKAIALFNASKKDFEKSEEYVLIQADMLRRISKFSEVIDLLKNIQFQDDSYQNIAEYQMVLSMNKDSACHKEAQAHAYAEKFKRI